MIPHVTASVKHRLCHRQTLQDERALREAAGKNCPVLPFSMSGQRENPGRV